MAISGTDLALTTCRLGAARVGAFRLGFAPCFVKGVGAVEPGEYGWDEIQPPTTQWTLLTEDCVCGRRPTAAFSNTSCPSVNEVVMFTDESTPTSLVTFWLWDFGDGSTSNDQNPTHQYAAAGNYTVTLYISGPNGTATTTGTVVVMEVAVAVDSTPVGLGDTATFTPAVTGGIAPLTYDWTFDHPGLFAAWNMDDPVGVVTQSSVRSDILGNYDLTDQWLAPGAVAVATGEVGDGTTYLGGVAFSNTGDLEMPADFTVTGWFYISVDGDVNQYIFSYANNTTPGTVTLHVWTTQFNGVRFFTDDDPGDEVDSGVAITTGTWHFFAATHDSATGTNSITVDYDGPVSVAGQPDPVAGPVELRIGRHAGGSGQLYGGVDALQIWDKVLSGAEISVVRDGWEPIRSTDEIPSVVLPTTGVTTATLTVTDSGGCTATDTETVVVGGV